MHHLRRNGFFALVAIALCACGSVAAQELSTTPQPSATSSASPSSSNIPTCPATSPVSYPAGPISSSPAPQATSNATAAPTQTFCETPAEEALGEVPVHSPTIPDSVLLSDGISLTSCPSATPTVTEAQAEQLAQNQTKFIGGQTQSAVLAEDHDVFGNPAEGPLVWVVDVTPTTSTTFMGHTAAYAYVVIDAEPGQVNDNPAGEGVHIDGGPSS